MTVKNPKPNIILFQPDIPGNTGTILRMAACLGGQVHIIEPAGFRLDNKSLQRAGMDYLERTRLQTHDNWEQFEVWRQTQNSRLIALTTKSQNSYTSFEFLETDCLMFGRESAGLPDPVQETADHQLTIPMIESGRSLNLAVSVAMVFGEALRQI